MPFRVFGHPGGKRQRPAILDKAVGEMLILWSKSKEIRWRQGLRRNLGAAPDVFAEPAGHML
jgi:hypothetical protein